MPKNLVRYQQSGNLHFVTFSCYRRLPYLTGAAERELFERSLETMRVRYDFFVIGYVVMPEHVHLLVSEPRRALLAKALQALKLSVAVQTSERPFWQRRYYDFNVFTEAKIKEKLRYMHAIRLVEVWSGRRRNGSGLASGTGGAGRWAWWMSNRTGRRGEEPAWAWARLTQVIHRTSCKPTSQNRDMGHPVPRRSSNDAGDPPIQQ